MIKATTTVTDRATPVVLAIAESVKPERLKPIVGRAAVNVFRNHLFAADRSKPNAIGGTRTHFYASAARGTHFEVLPDGVLISVNQVGYRQRVTGGTIRPKTKKFLTIPVAPEAHGKRASEFGDLEVIFDHNGRPVALASKSSRTVQLKQTKSGKITKKLIGHHGEILFRLVTSVTQRPDPSVVPTAFDLYAAIKSNVNSFVEREAQRARAKAAGTPPK